MIPGQMRTANGPLREVPLPRPVNAERIQSGSLALVKIVLNHVIHAAAARPTSQAGPQFRQIFQRAGGHNFHVAFFGIAHPAPQIEFTRLPVHIPPEADPLHAPFD